MYCTVIGLCGTLKRVVWYIEEGVLYCNRVVWYYEEGGVVCFSGN